MIFMTATLGLVGVLAIKFMAVWKILAAIVSMGAICVIVYAGVRLREVLAAESKKIGHLPSWTSDKRKKNERWERIETYMRSNNPSDWKIAVLEADNILDSVVEQMGYPGETLGERMKAIDPSGVGSTQDSQSDRTQGDRLCPFEVGGRICDQYVPPHLQNTAVPGLKLTVYLKIVYTLGSFPRSFPFLRRVQ